MSFNVSALVNYVIENQDLLVTKSLFGARTAELIMSEGTVMTGVKYAERINILDTDAIFQNGSGCTRTSSGTTTFSQRMVTIGEIAVVEDICIKDLNKTYLSKALAKGSTEQQIPFEKQYTDLKTKTINKQLEIALWQGDTTSGNANLSRFDGLLKSITGAGGYVDANPTGAYTIAGGITTSNVKAIVDAMWMNLPDDVTGQEDVRIFCGWDTFNKFISAYTTLNLFAFAPDGTEVDAAKGVVIIPGTTYRLTAVHGLDGTNKLASFRMSNLFLGVDLQNEEEEWTIMEDQFKDYLRYKVLFKYGVNFAFPAEIVYFTLK